MTTYLRIALALVPLLALGLLILKCRTHALDRRHVLTRDLDLPRGLERERGHVHAHGEDYHLRGFEVRGSP